MMPLIKFYYAPFSSSGITEAVLAELEAASGQKLAERVEMSLHKSTRSAWYLAINPNGQVPTITDSGGQAVWESAAITMYLGEEHGTGLGLYPGTAAGRGQAAKWLVWTGVNLPTRARTIVSCGGEEGAKTAARTELEALLGVLDGGLEGREYLLGAAAGGGYSLVDTHVWAYVRYVGRLEGVEVGKWKNLGMWLERVGGREALRGL